MSVVFSASMASNFSEWTSETDTGGTLNWSADAGLAGTSGGMAVTAPGNTTAMYLAKTITDNTSGSVRGRFYFDPNSMTLAHGSGHTVYQLYNLAFGALVSMTINYETLEGYRIKFYYRNDAGLIGASMFTITDAPHCIEFLCTKSNGSNNGTFYSWIDGTAKDAVTGIDNDTAYSGFKLLRAGAVADLDSTTTGTYYMDEFIVNDDGSEIGPVAGGTIPRVMHHLRQQGIS